MNTILLGMLSFVAMLIILVIIYLCIRSLIKKFCCGGDDHVESRLGLRTDFGPSQLRSPQSAQNAVQRFTSSAINWHDYNRTVCGKAVDFEQFYERHITITDTERRLFQVNGEERETIRGVRQSRIPVGMAVEIINCHIRGTEFEFNDNTIKGHGRARSRSRSRDRRQQTVGHLNEPLALELYSKQFYVTVRSDFRDFVRVGTPWLIGELDGAVMNDNGQGIRKVLEVKSPEDAKTESIKVLARSRRLQSVYYSKNQRKYFVKPNCPHAIQVQLYCFLTNCDCGEVIYYSPIEEKPTDGHGEIVVATVRYDIDSIAEWLEVLKKFYFDKMLPAIIRSAR